MKNVLYAARDEQKSNEQKDMDSIHRELTFS